MLQTIKYLLLDIVGKIDGGTSKISEEDAISIIKLLKQYTDMERRVSKYEACSYLGISRATFDNYVRDGLIPRGEHQVGFKELSWKLSDIEKLR